MDLITVYDITDCIMCKSKNTMNAISVNGVPISLSKAIENNNFDKFTYSHLQCSNCGREYNIDWSEEDRLPRAIYNGVFTVDVFLRQLRDHRREIRKE